MFGFFSSLVDIISTAVNSVLSFLQMLGRFISMVVSAFVWLSYAIDRMPSFVNAFVLAFVSVAVICRVLNRD